MLVEIVLVEIMLVGGFQYCIQKDCMIGVTRLILQEPFYYIALYCGLRGYFKIVQNRPTVKAVCTKISKKMFCIFVNIFIFLRENNEVSFFIF